ILKCLNADATVPARKYTVFSEILENNEIGQFLAMTFLYAINRPNKLMESKPVADDFPLLDEVGNECPICRKKLTRKVKGVTTRQYGI
ncbi:ABC-three component system protein, partial [Enterococcus faecalis]